MTYEQLSQKGYIITEKEIETINKLILEEYKTALNEIKIDVKDAYAKYLTGSNREDFYLIMKKNKRLQKLVNTINTIINKLFNKVSPLFINASNMAFTNNYYRQLYAAQWLLEKATFTKVNEDAVLASVLGETNRAVNVPYVPKYGNLVQTLNNNKQATIQKMNTIVTQAVLQGKGTQEAAREIRNLLNTSLSNAKRISRTEIMRNLNSGAYSNFKTLENKGHDVQRKYIATLDTRTRPQSGDMDGQIATDKGFLYPNGIYYQIIGNTGVAGYDINDRCTEVSIINEQSPDKRSGRNPVTNKTEIIDDVQFNDWLKMNNLTRNKSGKIVSK